MGDWDEIVLDPEMSPIVSVRSTAVPAFLPTKSEVCSLDVLAKGGGGSVLRQPPWQFKLGRGGGVCAAAAPLAVVESVTAPVSVLPDVGSELPTV